MNKKDSVKVDSHSVPVMIACAVMAVALTVVIVYLILSGGKSGDERATDVPTAENTDVAVLTEEAGGETVDSPEKTTGKDGGDTGAPESEKTPETNNNAGSETVSPEETGKTFTGDINFDDIPDGPDVTVDSGNAATVSETKAETVPETKAVASPETKAETVPETKAETSPETKRTGGEDGWSPDIR